ncbi:MAG TPA: sialidase family protein [Steroidobacteraceae bacterium]|nr:sialidase family protein [Steroidobacteraceae bacterium]
MRTAWIAAFMALTAAQTSAAEFAELPSPAKDGSLAPNLFATAEGRVLMSWIDRLPGERHALRFAVWEGQRWSDPQLVAEGAEWFVNWADFPSIVALPDGSLAAHWLVKSAAATYAYDVRIARSIDGGASWSAPIVPHRDGTPTEHGFVSLFPARNGGLGAAWLDGRETIAAGTADGEAGGAMTLRFATVAADGRLGDETLLDARVCDCCQTSAAITSEGPLIVYRDRSSAELRDVAVLRLRDGAWTDPQELAGDGWQIHGCPVNGPAVAADVRRVAVAWFTAANDDPRVKVAFSADAGASFGMPIPVDDGRPLGRVDTVLLDDGSAIVSWVESSPEGSSLRLRRIRPDGQRGAAVVVVAAGEPLANGFPQMVRAGGQLVLAWTAGRIRTAVLPIPATPGPLAPGNATGDSRSRSR